MIETGLGTSAELQRMGYSLNVGFSLRHRRKRLKHRGRGSFRQNDKLELQTTNLLAMYVLKQQGLC